MGPTFSMLAAGLLVAQTADPSALNSGKPCPCQKNATAGVIQPVAATTAAPSSPGFFRGMFQSNSEQAPVVVEPRPTLMSKIQGMFGKKSETVEPAAAPFIQMEQAKPAPARQLQRLPAGQPTAQPNDSGARLVPMAGGSANVQPVTYQGVPPTQSAPVMAANPVIPASHDTNVKTTVMASSRPNRISQDLIGKVGHESDYSWITGQLRIENGLYVIHYATPEVVDAHNGSLVLTSDHDIRGFQDGDFVSVRGNLAGSANGRSLYRLTNMDRMPR